MKHLHLGPRKTSTIPTMVRLGNDFAYERDVVLDKRRSHFEGLYNQDSEQDYLTKKTLS